MADTFPVDYASEVGRIRKYIPDVRQVDGEFIFSDEELESFLEDEQDGRPLKTWHILRAAAMAMIALANDENLILKKIITEDLQTDGPAVSKQLIDAANRLLVRAAANAGAEEDELFFVVDYQPTPARIDWR